MSWLNWSAIFSTTPIGRLLIASWYCEGSAGLKVSLSDASTLSGTVTIAVLAFTTPAGVLICTPQGLSQLIEVTGVFSLTGTPLAKVEMKLPIPLGRRRLSAEGTVIGSPSCVKLKRSRTLRTSKSAPCRVLMMPAPKLYHLSTASDAVAPAADMSGPEVAAALMSASIEANVAVAAITLGSLGGSGAGGGVMS